jgi:hypothetical protein
VPSLPLLTSLLCFSLGSVAEAEKPSVLIYVRQQHTGN